MTNTHLSPTNYLTQTVSVTEENFNRYLIAVKELGSHYLMAKLRDHSNLSNTQISQIHDMYYDLLEEFNLDSPLDL